MKDLNTILNSISISADWIGLREVCENRTFRSIRDLTPQSNTRVSSHGIMVEVLNQGQFGYSATSDLSESGINLAAKKALENANSGSKKGLYAFDASVRPKAVGNYESPYVKDMKSMSPGQINEILLKATEKISYINDWIEKNGSENIILTDVSIILCVKNGQKSLNNILEDFKAQIYHNKIVDLMNIHNKKFLILYFKTLNIYLQFLVILHMYISF